MKRTQIYLSDETHAALRRAATEQGKTLATLAREMLEAQFAAPRVLREQAVVYAPARVRRAKKTRAAKKPRAKKLTQAELEANPLYQMIGLGNSGLGDLAERHDTYLLHRERKQK
jgi:predicted DNA-binding protein